MQGPVARLRPVAAREKVGGALQFGQRNAFQRRLDGKPQWRGEFHGVYVSVWVPWIRGAGSMAPPLWPARHFPLKGEIG
ncbi:hypothetical protein PPNSA23_25770 [Phyllobacterium phragmitis]|uniref:Uncharacterized protein n=1 Tax=Phyllobacterium phragmitis TaxID=2670329 RepID=A0ABQ0H132_9HYPH